MFGLYAAGPALGVPPLRPLSLRSTALPLGPFHAAQGRIGRLSFLGAVQLRSGDRRFGGMSGLIYEGECRRLLAISDTGSWIALSPMEEGDRLTGVAQGSIVPLLDRQGRPPASKFTVDAEELARDGADVLVFFEQRHRIERFADASGCRPQSLDRPPVAELRPAGVAGWPRNGGMEAATVVDGLILVLSEEERGPGDSRRALAIRPDGTSTAFLWKPPAGYRPTAMDWFRDDAGRLHLIVLHRRLSLTSGLEAIVTEAVLDTPPSGAMAGTLADALAGKVIEGTEVAHLARPDPVDNMEGLAVRHEGGRVFLYLVSDDNFSPLERVLLLKFELLPEGGEAARTPGD